MINIFRHRYVALACRLSLGATLATAGVGKLLHQAGLHQGGLPIDLAARLGVAGIVPQPVIDAGAWALPPLEIVLGALLAAGLFLRPASMASVLLVLGFMAVNVYGLVGGANELECECFGDLAAISPRDALLIDMAMLVMSIQVLFHRSEFLSLDSRRWTRGRGPGAGGQGSEDGP